MVLAGVAGWIPDDLVTIKLFDASEERLDLFDRFLRECIDKSATEHVAMSTTSIAEAFDGATDVVFCVHEDCARRMMGRLQPELYDPPKPEAIPEQVLGDPNRPTPPEKLSSQTHTFLSAPLNRGESREEAITMALVKLLEHMPLGCRVLSLERGVELPTQEKHVHLDWPEPVPETQLPTVPHQVLRWIQGEDTLEQLLAKAKATPFAEWLNG